MKTKKLFLPLLLLLTFIVFTATAQTTGSKQLNKTEQIGKDKKSCCVESCSKKSTETAQQKSEKCPLKDTPDCPLVKDCPKKCTANCPYTTHTKGNSPSKECY